MAANSPTLQLAIQYHRANRLTDAQQAYHQVLQEQPQHPEALYGLGMLAQQVGQFPAAVELLSTAVSVQPELLKGWFSLGNLQQSQGQFPAAESAYCRAIALQPDAAPIYNNLGYTLQQQGKWAEAINSYQKALDLKPDLVEAEANLGNALHAQGQLSHEQKIYYAQLNYKLGVAQSQAGKGKIALAYYQYAIALQPDLAAAHHQLGVVLQTQGKIEEAIASYQKALELNPQYGEVYLSLGKIYQDQHQIPQAIAAYRQGLELINPHYAAAVAAIEDTETPQSVPVTPPILPGEVIFGKYSFPSIPKVDDSVGNRPFWSVVITVYNRIDYLLECLASVLAQWQGEKQMEIIVMDDASKTPIFDIVNSLSKGIIHYYRNPQNLGLPGNWNAGIALSRGQWVHLLHDDDYILPGFYSRLQASLEECSESIGAAFTGYQNINEKGEVIFSQQVYGDKRKIAENWLQKIGVGNSLNMPAVVIRREAHERLGVYHPELIYTSDWELYKRVAAVYEWWYEPEILARYREHTNNVTSELMLSGKQMTSIRQAIEMSASYLPSNLSAEITSKSRNHHFNYCLASTAVPLKAQNLAGAWGMLEEALKMDRSSEAVAKLFSWLTQQEATPLRDEMASRLISLSLNEPVVNT